MIRYLLPCIMLFTACQSASNSAGAAAADQLQQDTGVPVPTAVTSNVQELIRETDTVTIGEQLYKMLPVAESDYNAVPGFVIDTSEVRAMAPYKDKVFRNGDTLTVLLGNGKRELMINNPNDNDDYANFQFLGLQKDMNHYVVEKHGYEWYDFLLIHAVTGKITETIGVPNVSPDKKYAICSNNDLFAGFTTNGFELLRILPGGAEIILSRQMEKWGPVEIKWLDANTMAGRIKVIKGNEDAQMEEEERLVKFVPR